MTNQPTCEERINEHFQSVLEDMEVIIKCMNEIDPDDLTDEDKKIINNLGQDPEEIQDTDWWQVLNEYGLSLELDSDTRGAHIAENFKQSVNEYEYDEKEAAMITGEAAVKWCLSWGGPADYFIFEYVRTPGGWWEIGSIAYCFQDWFDGAVRYLTGDDYETMESIMTNFLEFESLL